ncbi:MAG: SPOR domain-containing protein [Pseudomonadota bacterium]
MAGTLPFFTRSFAAFSVSALLLAGCGEDGLASLNLGLGQQDETEETDAPAGPSVKTVERDVEAPEVFGVTDKALWDGRPSLGGVWIAHPDNKEPERVIIRNEATGKFVVGALFRRERDNPGPAFQLSSDAAAALGVQAGTPAVLKVTALRREEVPVAAPAPVTPGNTEDVTSETLDKTPADTAALTTAALASIEGAEKPKPAAPKPAAATPAPKPSVDKPFVQIGFFSVEDNATANLAAMKSNGIPARIVSSSTNGKTFWRVIAGPAGSASEQRQLLSMVKKLGFDDAYFVRG